MEGDVDWRLCCLCQDRFSHEELRSTKEGLESLAKQLLLFKQNGVILLGVLNDFTDEDELITYLKTNEASYRKKLF